MGDHVPNGGMFGGPLKREPGIQISAISFDDTCVLSVVGQYAKEDAQALQSTLDTIVQEIEIYLSNERKDRDCPKTAHTVIHAPFWDKWIILSKRNLLKN